MHASSFVDRLAEARIGVTFNQYTDAWQLRERLAAYLEAREGAAFLLVGEAAGYRGARVSGVPFTSERQLTGTGPAEATATIVHLLWNVVPTHPHRPGEPDSNRRPTANEVAASRRFVDELARGRRVIAAGRLAEAALDVPAVRHPSHGGAHDFRAGLARLLHD